MTGDVVIGGGAAATSIVIGGVAVLKRAWPDFEWDRFGPLVNVGIAVFIVGAFVPITGDTWAGIQNSVALGIAVGLSAGGLYDGAKRLSGRSGSVSNDQTSSSLDGSSGVEDVG